MALWKVFTLISVAIIAEARWHHQKRETKPDICSPAYNNTNKVQCYCMKGSHSQSYMRTADCFLTDNINSNDRSWGAFDVLRNTTKLTLTNTKEIVLSYIPTDGIKHLQSVTKLDIKYADINTVPAFAFANLSTLEEITLRDDQINVLAVNAFAHHRELISISLDKNNIVEINRNVFVDLPSLEKLYLTSNKITTIHDKAFVHLVNLRELEIDRNNLFSLNSESFIGLKKLQKLDLSTNSLEVIGDNTFLPLINLRSLNLEGNKIQMLDGKAFNGLAKMQSLSLSHNNLTNLDNVKLFEALDTLSSLSLKGNKISELKTEVMAPILSNFYLTNSNLDVEDNKFPCDCRLDWFMSLMNKTLNNHLRLTIENLKCYPDQKLREIWTKSEETDKSTGQVFEEEESQVQNTDYEYYDDTQLDGRLFYIDVRHFLNCTNKIHRNLPVMKPDAINTTKVNTFKTTKVETTPRMEEKPKVSSVVTSSPTTSKVTEFVKVENRGLLDLSVAETSTTTEMVEAASNKIISEIDHTTSRLATVSAKPIENGNIFDHDMASDEAKPEKVKSHRSIDENIKEAPFKMNSAIINTAYVPMLIIVLGFRLFN